MYKDSSCRSSSSQHTANTKEEAEIATSNSISSTASSAVTASVRSCSNSPQLTQRSGGIQAPLASVELEDDYEETEQHPAIDSNAAIEEDVFSCPSESSDDEAAEYHNSNSRPSTSSTNTTTSSSSGSGAIVCRLGVAVSAVSHPCRHRSELNSDVRLLRKIGYIASRVRFLSKFYGDFKLVNPYSSAKQKRQLRDILLKHSIVDPDNPQSLQRTLSPSPASSVASSYCCLPHDSSCEDDSQTLTNGTVRRKSSVSHPSITLLEDLLIQFYEERRNKITVIRRRRSKSKLPTSSNLNNNNNNNSKTHPRKHLIIMSGQTAAAAAAMGAGSIERLFHSSTRNDNDENDAASINIPTTTTTTTTMTRNNMSFLQPTSAALGEDNQRRRRASDCSSHPSQMLQTQLQVTLKNNNCTTKFPYHRGSCGAAGDHLLAANSIANRATIILSKSCSNVEGAIISGNSNVASNAALYGSSEMKNLSTNSNGGNGSSAGNGHDYPTSGSCAYNSAAAAAAAAASNGNNEYSIVQLNNTIIQCHFNDDDFRALVKDLKRKVEYTERMNWLCKY